jgi:hypothetical protein
MNFEEWISQIINTEKPSNKIIGYYFGLFETDGKEYMMYLLGSKVFDVDDDWACNNDFEPKEKYLHLPQYNGFGWEDVLTQTVKILQEFITTDIYKSSFFAKAQGISTGFDGGDLTQLAQLHYVFTSYSA